MFLRLSRRYKTMTSADGKRVLLILYLKGGKDRRGDDAYIETGSMSVQINIVHFVIVTFQCYVVIHLRFLSELYINIK
jgi:hypothetical protein